MSIYPKLVVFIVSLLIAAASVQAEESPLNSRTFVFVHGAFGGGWDYQNMESILEAKGHKVYRPTLTGLGARVHLSGPDVNLDTHILDIVNLLKYEDLTGIVLVGHSYAGMVISGVADRVPERIAHLVYVDAAVPEDGEAFMDLLPQDYREKVFRNVKSRGDGWKIIPAWTEPGRDVAHPLLTWLQAVSLKNPAFNDIPATYIQAVDPDAKTEAPDKSMERAKARGWVTFEVTSGHNLQRDVPGKYAEILMNAKVRN